ncbi:RNA helicase required for poly(A+) mRNA export, partial [Spiromyces aspiralis]
LFEKVRVFVLDEADNMLGPHGQGLGQQTLRIRSFVPKACQFVLFSATFPENIRRFASKFAPDANELLLEAEEVTVKEIKQFFIRTEPAKKLEILSLLYDLLSLSQSVIFVQRRATADMVMRMMTEKGNSVVSLHGECTPVERDRIMDDFRDGKVKVLVSTNVIARGIDVAQVSMVVNYDMPVDLVGMADTETYIHRIGRTGRFGRTGISVNLIDSEESMQVQRTIELEQGVKITEVPVDDWEQMENMLK